MENFGLQIPGVYFSGQNTDVGIALNFNDGETFANGYPIQHGSRQLSIGYRPDQFLDRSYPNLT